VNNTNDLIILGNGDLSDKFIKMQDLLLPDYAIEVGAHEAEFSVTISSKLKIPAVAFEAGKAIYERVKSKIVGDLVKYLNYAISDKDGVESFSVNENEHAGNNSILVKNDVTPIKTEEIKSYRLDTYFKDTSFASACLWIDVEGANKQVLSGAKETLKRVSSIFIETEDYPYWKDQWLTSDVVKFLNSQGFVLTDSEKVYAAQQNLIFVRRSNDNKTS
jgi:FkbM family methyltransferase